MSFKMHIPRDTAEIIFCFSKGERGSFSALWSFNSFPQIAGLLDLPWFIHYPALWGVHHLDSLEGANWSQLRSGKLHLVLLLLYQFSTVSWYVSVLICKPCATLPFLIRKAFAEDCEKLPAEWTAEMNCKTDLENQAFFVDTSWNSFSRSVLGILKTCVGRSAPEPQNSAISAASVHSLCFSIKWQVRLTLSWFPSLRHCWSRSWLSKSCQGEGSN